MRLFLPLGTPQPFPSCAGVERRLRAFAPRNRDGVRRRPRFGPLAILLRRAWLASGRLCRRPSGGRMFEAAVLQLLRTDSSAGLAGHVKRRPQSPGTDGIHGVRLRGVNLHSARSSALSGRRGSGDIRFMVRGERPKADHVGFLEAKMAKRREFCIRTVESCNCLRCLIAFSTWQGSNWRWFTWVGFMLLGQTTIAPLRNTKSCDTRKRPNQKHETHPSRIRLISLVGQSEIH